MLWNELDMTDIYISLIFKFKSHKNGLLSILLDTESSLWQEGQDYKMASHVLVPILNSAWTNLLKLSMYLASRR